MEKNSVEKFRNQYVKLVKDSGEILNGAIVQILDDSIIFQTEISRSGVSMKSIREIMPIDEINKRRRTVKSYKF